MPVFNNPYDTDLEYFVLYTNDDCYDTSTGPERLTLEIREYIDDHFQWVDGYKPKLDTIDETHIKITRAVSTESRST